MLDPTYSIIRDSLSAAAPAKLPIDIVQYKGFYAYRFSLDDFNGLPETKKADFAEWLKARAKAAEQLTGTKVTIEWE